MFRYLKRWCWDEQDALHKSYLATMTLISMVAWTFIGILGWIDILTP